MAFQVPLRVKLVDWIAEALLDEENIPINDHRSQMEPFQEDVSFLQRKSNKLVDLNNITMEEDFTDIPPETNGFIKAMADSNSMDKPPETKGFVRARPIAPCEKPPETKGFVKAVADSQSINKLPETKGFVKGIASKPPETKGFVKATPSTTIDKLPETKGFVKATYTATLDKPAETNGFINAVANSQSINKPPETNGFIKATPTAPLDKPPETRGFVRATPTVPLDKPPETKGFVKPAASKPPETKGFVKATPVNKPSETNGFIKAESKSDTIRPPETKGFIKANPITPLSKPPQSNTCIKTVLDTPLDKPPETKGFVTMRKKPTKEQSIPTPTSLPKKRLDPHITPAPKKDMQEITPHPLISSHDSFFEDCLLPHKDISMLSLLHLPIQDIKYIPVVPQHLRIKFNKQFHLHPTLWTYIKSSFQAEVTLLHHLSVVAYCRAYSYAMSPLSRLRMMMTIIRHRLHQYSVLRDVIEGDLSPGVPMVLQVLDPLHLTDGFYIIPFEFEYPIPSLEKIYISNATCQGEPGPIESNKRVLLLSKNSTRVAHKYSKLGLTDPMLVAVHAIVPNGGVVPILQVRLVKVYKCIYYVPDKREHYNQRYFERYLDELQETRQEMPDVRRYMALHVVDAKGHGDSHLTLWEPNDDLVAGLIINTIIKITNLMPDNRGLKSTRGTFVEILEQGKKQPPSYCTVATLHYDGQSEFSMKLWIQSIDQGILAQDDNGDKVGIVLQGYLDIGVKVGDCIGFMHLKYIRVLNGLLECQLTHHTISTRING